jgi:hypothetical protein
VHRITSNYGTVSGTAANRGEWNITPVLNAVCCLDTFANRLHDAGFERGSSQL